MFDFEIFCLGNSRIDLGFFETKRIFSYLISFLFNKNTYFLNCYVTERRNRIQKTREPARIECDRINHRTGKQHLILISKPEIFGNGQKSWTRLRINYSARVVAL